jgi:agmatine/peptidylarginine deiminase
MLATPKRIYFPQFGIKEDAEALAAIRSWTDKNVIPVRSDQVCKMGGGVRCMSWQLRGVNAARLSSHLRTD